MHGTKSERAHDAHGEMSGNRAGQEQVDVVPIEAAQLLRPLEEQLAATLLSRLPVSLQGYLLPGAIRSGLVTDSGLVDHPFLARPYGTTARLDRMAESCERKKGDIFAVGLVVPRARLAERCSSHNADPFVSHADDKPIFVVAANSGVPQETKPYVRAIASELRRLANKSVLPTDLSDVDPDKLSPRPHLSEQQNWGQLSLGRYLHRIVLLPVSCC